MDIKVRKFRPSLAHDFFALHSLPPGDCFCAFWWLEEGVDWAALTADDNRKRREALLARGEYDGYLAYVDGRIAGWCQAGPRDRLAHLVRKLSLPPDPSTWAISCFFVAPEFRRKGVSARLLAEVLKALAAKGARRVEAYPRKGEKLSEEDLWNGPESMLRRAGFKVVQEDASRRVLALQL